MKNRRAGHQGVELAKSKAGVLRAGVLAPAGTALRATAAVFLLTELKDKVSRRNTMLENVQRGIVTSEGRVLIRGRQLDIDTILWIITCCGLVEVDEQAQRIAACPEDCRATLSEVLGTSQRR